MTAKVDKPTSLVVVFCGPHDNDGKVSFRRVDAGIQGALQQNLPLVICGDGNGGYDCHLFEQRAKNRGVPHVQANFDPRASTLSDADSVSFAIRHMDGYASIIRVFLVTDWWHMERAALFLGRLLLVHMPQRSIQIQQAPVPCPSPPEDQLEAEKRGIRDFLAGRYDLAQRGQPYGKPVPGTRGTIAILA